VNDEIEVQQDAEIQYCELYIVTRRPKAGTVKSEETSIAGHRLGKHIPTATNTQATIE
jgi:hypothetical protein